MDEMPTLSFASPARRWLDGLPVGNGRLGAMWYGDETRSVIALNDETFFSPGPRQRDLSDARAALAEVREHLDCGEIAEAQLAARALLGVPSEMAAYQPVGAVHLEISHADDRQDFTRGIDLEAGVAWQRGRAWQRLRGVRAPSVMVLETLDCPEWMTISLVSPFAQVVECVDDRTVVLTGAWRQAEANRRVVAHSFRLRDTAPYPHTRFAIAARVAGGDWAREDADDGPRLMVSAGPSTLAIAIATDLEVDDPVQGCLRDLASLGEPAPALNHAEAWHREIMGRASVMIGNPAPLGAPGGGDQGAGAAAVLEELTTDARMHALRVGGVDDELLLTIADFGRYLLVASGVGGRLPPTLQGVWNEDIEPPWSSRWTLNINLQMNLWPTGPWSLPEAADTLLEFVESLAEAGERTAAEIYGARGWVVHHNTDIWRATAPTTSPEYSLFPCAGLWLCDQLAQLARFFPDEQRSRRVQRLLAGCLELAQSLLVEDEHGQLITSPSSTPENAYVIPGAEERADDLRRGPDPLRQAWLCHSSTIDRWLLGALVADLRELAHLGQAWEQQLDAIESRLAPVTVEDGRIGEWAAPVRPVDRGHRHLSSLYGIYPGNLDRRVAPELAAAAERTLAERQSEVRSWDHGWGGWSKIWAGCCWARLGDAERAYECLLHWARTGVSPLSLLGVFPEFDGSPLDDAGFQIDANLGAPALLAEMLVQSHTGRIELLPALPARWRCGSFRGLRVLGGHAVDAEWSGGELTMFAVHPVADGVLTLVVPPGRPDRRLWLEGSPEVSDGVRTPAELQRIGADDWRLRVRAGETARVRLGDP